MLLTDLSTLAALHRNAATRHQCVISTAWVEGLTHSAVGAAVRKMNCCPVRPHALGKTGNGADDL